MLPRQQAKLEVLTAILAIAVIELAAIAQGIDGIAFGTAVAAISGLGGFKLSRIISHD